MLNNQSSMTEITESVKYINEVFLPSVKQKLASKTHYSADNTFDALINNIAVDKLGGKRWASGFVTSASNASLNITGLSFRPRVVSIISTTKGSTYGMAERDVMNDFMLYCASGSDSRRTIDFWDDRIYVYNVSYGYHEFRWLAYE